jgi:hypothetical protein
MEMAKRKLPPDFLAALNAGAVSPEAAAAAQEAEDTTTGDEGAQAPAAEAAAAPTAEKPAATDPPAAAATDKPGDAAAAPAVAAKDESALVSHLRGELKDVRTELSALQLEHSKTKEKLTAAETTQPALVSIVKKASEVMAIALGTTAVGLDSMSPEALCKYHAELSSQMAKKYPVGGKAVDTAQPAKDNTATSDASSPARRAAVSSASIK